MITRYTVYRPGADEELHEVDLPFEPGYDKLRALIEPLLDGVDMEHVYVLHEGERLDMFVGDIGLIKGLPRNEEATRIYRNATLSQHPETPAESLSPIVGPAVLFHRQVWF